MTTNNATNTPTPISVPNGGTGATSLTAYGIIHSGSSAGAAFTSVAPSSNTNFVLTGQTSGLSTWGLPGSAGNVLQVKSTTTNTRSTTSSASYVDVSGLSVAITPLSSSSKVFIIVQISLGCSSDFTYPILLLRGSTPISQGSGGTGNQFNTTAAFGGNNPYNVVSIGFGYLDSPSTTASTTYKVQILATNGQVSIVNGTSNNGNTNYEGVLTSTITAMEIHG